MLSLAWIVMKKDDMVHLHTSYQPIIRMDENVNRRVRMLAGHIAIAPNARSEVSMAGPSSSMDGPEGSSDMRLAASTIPYASIDGRPNAYHRIHGALPPPSNLAQPLYLFL